MALFTLSATVNYPETEVETPTYTRLTNRQVVELIERMLSDEAELTSCVITLCKLPTNFIVAD